MEPVAHARKKRNVYKISFQELEGRDYILDLVIVEWSL